MESWSKLSGHGCASVKTALVPSEMASILKTAIQCCRRFLHAVVSRWPMELNIGLEARVHLQLDGVDHTLSWQTQRKTEGRSGGIRRG